MNKAIQQFFKDKNPSNIYSYKEFMQYSEENVNKNKQELNDKDQLYFEYQKINLHRVNRVQKTFKPIQELVDIIQSFDETQTWLIITEDWCGDSAQNIPYFAKYAEFNPKINIQIILRDSNLEAIDNYFTEGNPKSIPKIVGFDKDGNELFIWGPRPKFAQDLVQKLKAEGYTKKEFNEKLHLWYGRNRGKELEKELIVLFSSLR